MTPIKAAAREEIIEECAKVVDRILIGDNCISRAIRALKPQDGGKRTPLDLQAPDLNTLATDAFREAAQKDGGESGR